MATQVKAEPREPEPCLAEGICFPSFASQLDGRQTWTPNVELEPSGAHACSDQLVDILAVA